ncbi:MAG: ATP synthase F1 subunit delta [Bryobacterales bacterium]|jgi:F-type H+-transporting ATPase subunit delta|nr:ATP synthase F1 subunit delta [Bryobacterales bacterium]
MTSTASASRYARALADVVSASSGAIDPARVVKDLQGFEEALAGSIDLRRVLLSPAVAPHRKSAVLQRIGTLLDLIQPVRNFLRVVSSRRRLTELTAIRRAFESMMDERMGVLQVDVVSAQSLTDAQQAALAGRMQRATGRQVWLRCEVDPELIGGALARIGSTVFDGSLRGRLEALGKRLAAG